MRKRLISRKNHQRRKIETTDEEKTLLNILTEKDENRKEEISSFHQIMKKALYEVGSCDEKKVFKLIPEG